MRILVADDHGLFADLIKFFIERIRPDAEVAAAGTLAAAITACGLSDYDLVLLDLNMPGMNGATGIGRMRDKVSAPVVVISGATNRIQIRSCLKAGAAGFIPKTLPAKPMMHALEIVVAGQRYIPSALFEDVADGAVAESLEHLPTGDLVASLTPRENEVYQLLLAGDTNKEIARQMDISEVTVKMHLQKVYEKLGARNRADAVRIGLSAPALP
jgi:DNA-binding NarL/FixJ family response regulator